MDDSIQTKLDEQTLLLKDILRRLVLIEQFLTPVQPVKPINNISSSSALAHLRSLGEIV